MIELGTLSISDAPSFNESRRKVLQLVCAIGFCSLEGARMATLFSEAVRPSGGKSVRSSFRLVDNGPNPAIEIKLEYQGAHTFKSALGSFFDLVGSTETDTGCSYRLRRNLPLDAPRPDKKVLKSVRDMLKLPSREELLINLENKNKALERSEARIQATLESAPDSLLMVTPEGMIVYANSMAVSTFGYSKEELLGQPTDMLVPEEFRRDHPRRVEKFFKENKTLDFGMRQNIHAVCKDGSRISVDIKLSPLRTEEGMRAIASIRDVTAQRKAQEQRDEALEIISGSINYASRIQRSILPGDDFLDRVVPECFVLWEPRDVVGGDIYWVREWGDGIVLILADCTGHSVPGAFMTLISNGALSIGLRDVAPGDSGSLIRHMHQLVQQALGQDKCGYGDYCSDDGLDLGVCYIPQSTDTITFAGAGLPLFVCGSSGVQKVDGDRKGIGYRGTPQNSVWNNKIITVREGSRFYMSSDGIFDQVGGATKRGFGKKRFSALLESIQSIPMKEQGEAIYRQVLEHQGNERRRDDISAIGFAL